MLSPCVRLVIQDAFLHDRRNFILKKRAFCREYVAVCRVGQHILVEGYRSVALSGWLCGDQTD